MWGSVTDADVRGISGRKPRHEKGAKEGKRMDEERIKALKEGRISESDLVNYMDWPDIPAADD